MAETIAINIASGPAGTTFPTMGGTIYTASTVTDASKAYRIRLYGLGDCQEESGFYGPKGLHDGLWWQHDLAGEDKTFGDTVFEGTQVYLAWRKDSNSSFMPMPYKDFNPNHEYIYSGIPGNGQAWQFRFYDPRFWNNSGTLYIEIEEDNGESLNPSEPDCQVGIVAGEIGISNPIGIRHGEKREEISDISLNSPAGVFALVRSYSQNKQPEFQFMGLGWNHNHLMKLAAITGTPNELIVRLPRGGEGHFVETWAGSNHYEGVAGVGSFVDWNAGTSQYSLTASDKSIYVFDSNGNLLSRSWPNGETWSYSYSGSNLSEINDGYGRKLVFRYYISGDHNGQLYRVGDQTFDDTNPTNPTGRYVQYSYILHKVVDTTGAIVTSSGGDKRSLLTTVRDVQGQDWTYDYYGQDAAETDVRQLNFLIERSSPSVDTTGDGTADGSLSIENLTYTMQGMELAVNGGMENDSDWTSVNSPTTNERSTTQVDSGTYSRHVVASTAGQGIEGNTWNLLADKTYIVTAKVYLVSGAVKMQVSGETAFDRTSSGTGNWQLLRAVYKPSSAATGKNLQFVANGAAAEFYVDTVSVIESDLTVSAITQERGNSALITEFEFQPNAENITTELTAGKTTTHHFSNGVYAGPEDAGGNYAFQVQNSDYRPVVQQDANGNQTALSWSADGKRLTQVADALDQRTQFTYDSSERLQASIDAENRKTVYLYEAQDVPRQPTHIFVTNGGDLAVNGGMEADSDWTNVGTPSSNKRIPAAHSGQFTRHIVASAANQGIEGNSWNLDSGIAYTISARVYPVSGTVKMQVTGETAFDKTTIPQLGFWQILTATYTPPSNATGKKLQFIASDGAAEFYVDSVSISKAGVELAVNGDMEANSDWTDISGFAPTTNERTVGADAGNYARRIIASAANQGVQGNTWNLVADRNYLILARVYPVSGTVRMKVNGAPSGAFDQTTSGTGAWKTLRAVYKPTSAATGVRLQFLADGAAAEFYVDSVFILDSTMLLRWQEFSYDSQGRTLTEKVIDPADGTTVQQQVTRVYHASGNGNGLLHTVTQEDIGGSDDVVTTYTYDSAGRVIKTQQSSNFGQCDISFTVYDDAGNVVATICNYDPGMSADPTTAAEAVALYNANFPDKNRVTTYEYDTLGRRAKTVVNAGASFAVTTLTVFDALNRVIRTIGNYKPVTGVSHPYTAARSAFDGQHGTDNSENQVADTFYNARSMVRKQIDVLDTVTLFGYDDAGRLVKTIQSASQPNYNNDYTGGSPDPALGSYTPNGVVDQDIVTVQAYDAAGNLVKTVDPLGVVNYTVYDVLNRPVKTVRAAKDAATIALNPGDGSYNAANDPRSASYTPSTSPDRDLIETTEYDAMGRVIRTQRLLDNRPTAQWETMLYGYDTLGREVKVIRSASNAAYNIAADPDLSAYSASSNPDQDIVTITVYDDKSRVLYTEDALGSRTWIAYDGLGRQVKTIANAVGTATDGGSGDPRSGSYTPSSDPDKDLVTVTTYDTSGRVQSTQDPLNRVTRNVYDTLGRVIRTITNYIQQGGSDPATWVWDGTDNRWEYGSGSAVSHGTDNDQNIIADTVYDAQGRVSQTLDHRHNATLHLYDVMGRRVKTIVNYVVQGASNPANWLWDAADSRWEDGAGNAIAFGTDKDQNRITTTTYDLAGRVTRSRDAAGVETRFEYDAVGRRTKTTVNYVDGTYSASVPDEDLISTTAYNKGGQVVTATDARGTQTGFVYDKAGRRLKVTGAANNPLASTGYTSFDKAGRVLRSLQNWIDNGISPDAKTGSAWDFLPEHNGAYADRNLITQFAYDLANRRSQVTDPLGNLTQTAYFKDGQVQSMTDPENVVSQYRYDGLRRRTRVVQGYVVQGASDPKDWTWDATDNRWEYPTNNAVAHGTNNDQNIIVDVTYDKGGRVTSLRDPRGNVTSYANDQLDRRKSLTNPLSKTWSTAYADLTGGGTRVTMTYPGITGSSNYPVQRDFDRLGRLLSIDYGAPSVTPDVKLTYDNAGNRAKMSEYSSAGFTSRIRETTFGYDDVRRLTSAGFDNDGGGTVDETVAYEYDAGGLRTKLTMPGSLNVVYTYDTKGQLVSLTDWDSQKTTFAYDQVGRHIVTERANGLRSRYEHDAGGRLKRLRHIKDFRTLAHFEYEVDKRGNRIQALEALADAPTTTDTTIAYNDKGLALSGMWSEVSGFKETSQFNASLKLIFLGDEATLTMGTGPDHGMYDVYVGGSLWQAFDGYAASASQRDIVISLGVDSRKLQGEGPHLVEIRNRAEKNASASGYKVRFKQLLVVDRTWVLQTVKYSYDKLSRLLEARYAPGANAAAVDADLLRRYLYTYDRAGNRLSQSVALNGGSATVTNYTYNAANQLTSGSATYDNNGNLTSDGTNSYTWDRANRMLTHSGSGGTSYKYDGLSNLIQVTNFASVSDLLVDLQSPLPVMLRLKEPGVSLPFVHGPRGILAEKSGADWNWHLQDGLGSVRGRIKNLNVHNQPTNYAPYGALFETSINAGWHGFTGEFTPTTNNVYLRARYYNPAAGVFMALDPFEGFADRPMSLNGYSWVEGNVPNRTDPIGLCPSNPWSNDFPGQHCVWLANELHQKYNIPLEVLMQKDVLELQAIYTLGDLNNTFNQSSFSQAIRDNPLEGVGIAAGAIILAAGIGTGAIPVGAAIFIIGRAIIGGVAGAAIGGFAGDGLYQLAVSGQCGCQQKEAAIAMGQEEFVRRASATGAVVGTFNAGALSLGNAPAGYALQLYQGGVNVAQGGRAVVGAGQDVIQNGFTACNVIQGILGAAALAGGVGMLNYNRPTLYGNRLLAQAGKAAGVDPSNFVDVVNFRLFKRYPDFRVENGVRVITLDPYSLLRGNAGRLLIVSHELVHGQQFNAGYLGAAYGSTQYAINEVIAETIARARVEGYIGELPIGLVVKSDAYIAGWQNVANTGSNINPLP